MPQAPGQETARIPALGGSRGVARQERSRATVAALLEAASQLLVETGYRTASTNAIARRAGVSVGSLYQYFDSREDLFRALVAQHRDSMHGLARQALAAIEAGAEPAATLTGLLEDVVARHRAAPELMHAMDTQLNHLESDADREAEAAAMDAMVGRLARLLPGPEPTARARVWLAAECIASLARRLGHRPPTCASPEAIRAACAGMFRSLLEAPEPCQNCR